MAVLRFNCWLGQAVLLCDIAPLSAGIAAPSWFCRLRSPRRRFARGDGVRLQRRIEGPQLDGSSDHPKIGHSNTTRRIDAC
jgi:hypothetical protein